MKLIIEFNGPEVVSALSNEFFMTELYRIQNPHQNPVEIKPKIKKVTDEVPIQSKTEPTAYCQKRKYTRHQVTDKLESPWKAKEKPHIPRSRDKICDCGIPFHDDTKTNTRKWCSDICKERFGKVHIKTKKPSEIIENKEIPVKDTEAHPNQGESFYKKKLEEERQSKEDARLIESIREHPKLDLNKMHKRETISENVQI